jgi:hypothetical protein
MVLLRTTDNVVLDMVVVSVTFLAMVMTAVMTAVTKNLLLL